MADDLNVEDAIQYIRESIRADPNAVAQWRTDYGYAFQLFDAVEAGLIYDSDEAITDLGLGQLNDFYHDQEGDWETDDKQEIEITE